MAVSLTVNKTTAVAQDGTYTVTFTVTSATGMPPEIFVYTTSTSTYNHVASVFDIGTFPTTADTTMAFYRTSAVTLTYTDVSTASAATVNISSAISSLAVDYGTVSGTFPATSTTTYTG